MLEKTLDFERDFFFGINHTHSYFTDCVAWMYSYTKAWIPFFIILVFGLFYKKKPVEWIGILLAIALVVGLCDLFSSGVCKPLFARPRPTHHPEFKDQVRTLYGYMGSRYGFISGHAANSFGIAVFCSLLFKRKLFSIMIVVWATIVALSRVVLGVHFISDIMAGAFSGVLIALLVYFIYKWIYIKLLHKPELPVYSRKLVNNVTIVAASYMILIAAISPWLVSLIKG